MPTIRLNSAEWVYDEGAPLGAPGGFGEVFRGTGDVGGVAVKRLKLTASEAAHREMKIGKALAGRSLKHVVPVLDYGQDASSDNYFLVMPVCEKSLQDVLAEKGVLTIPEARSIALDVLAGLSEVGDIVHRDLKPGNVLFLEGYWRLADFGIAKFVADSTSLLTLRSALTAAYGAPEQWRGEASTHATDVYALGCMLHTMLRGAPPFSGSVEDVCDAHLHKTPPSLDVDARLSAFVGQMLRKPPASRPTIERCIDVISTVEAARVKPLHSGFLAAAGQVSTEAAAAEAAAQAAATKQRERDELIREADADLQANIGRLWAEIKAGSDEAKVSRHVVQLGRGTLNITEVAGVKAAGKQSSPYDDQVWDVAAYATLTVKRSKIVRPKESDEGYPIVYLGRLQAVDRDYAWSSTLFYGKSKDDSNYRWRETAFWTMGQSERDQPYALQPTDRDFQVAFSMTMGVANVAYGPLAIDGEDEDNFHERWLTLFAKAINGSLSRPDRLPVPDYYWRS